MTPLNAFMISLTANSIAERIHQQIRLTYLVCGIIPLGVHLGRMISSLMNKVPALEILSGRGVLVISGVLIACRFAIDFLNSPAKPRRLTRGVPQLNSATGAESKRRIQQQQR